MPDKKISDLTAGAPAQSTDLVPIDRSGANFKLALSDLSTVVGAGDVLSTVAASGASQTVNYATADVWDITLTANCTITLSGFTNAKADYLTLVLRQDGTGSRTVTWPAITWIGSGVAPVFQTAASSVDSVVLFSFDGGSTVFGIAQTSASGLRTGTSFPGSPSDADLFYRTDRRIMYEYDASSTHWLSLDRKYVSFNGSRVLGGTTTTGVYGFLPVFEDIYVESWVTVVHNGGINDGSNFWTLALTKQNAAQSSTTITSFSTNSDAVSTNTVHTVSIAAVIAAASFPCLFVNVSKTGTPATLDTGMYLVARSVG